MVLTRGCLRAVRDGVHEVGVSEEAAVVGGPVRARQEQLDLGAAGGAQRGHRLHGESVLFIGTQFSILYTFMYSPA